MQQLVMAGLDRSQAASPSAKPTPGAARMRIGARRQREQPYLRFRAPGGAAASFTKESFNP